MDDDPRAALHDATLTAVVRAAVDATGAERGWLLRADADGLIVAAVAGEGGGAALGTRRRALGIAGYVLGSGQPAALQLRPGDHDNDGAGGSDGVPRSVLAAPCVAGEVVGVLELADAPAGAFSYDDVETVTLLAEIAGAAIGATAPRRRPPTPAQLATRLTTLSEHDPTRYADVARAIEAMT